MRIGSAVPGIEKMAGMRPSERDHEAEKPYERQFRSVLADAMKKQERINGDFSRMAKKSREGWFA